MTKKMVWLLPTALIVCACLARLIPHAPNFTPILSIAMFAGASFNDRRIAFMVVLIAMLVSDAVLGYYSLAPLIYVTMALVVILGFWLRQHRSKLAVATIATLSSVLFFVISNLGVWQLTPLYTKDVPGLVACFVAAVPFFYNTLASTFMYSFVMFGLWSLLTADTFDKRMSNDLAA